MSLLSTYGHRLKNNRHPVRSAKDKLQIDQLVVGWVTTSEYWLLYIFASFLLGAEDFSRWAMAVPLPHASTICQWCCYLLIIIHLYVNILGWKEVAVRLFYSYTFAYARIENLILHDLRWPSNSGADLCEQSRNKSMPIT